MLRLYVRMFGLTSALLVELDSRQEGADFRIAFVLLSVNECLRYLRGCEKRRSGNFVGG